MLVSGEDDKKIRAAVATMAAELGQLPVVENVTWRIEAAEIERLRSELFPYRFSVIDAGVRQLLLAGQYQKIAGQALLNLFGPVSAGANTIIDDPFGLFLELQKNRSSNLNLEIADSLLRVSDTERPTYLLTLSLNGDPFSPALQQILLTRIEQQRELLAASGSIQMSGMLIHAAAGAQQAQTEISTIGLGSLLGITLAVLLVFGRIRPLMLMLVPVGVGCAFATAITLLIFGRIHLITLAFGAGLVGVSIDYALHFLSERRYSAAGEVLPKILAGLLLGLFSSVMAYAVMVLTPFPGLRQMASFSIAGLFASWLTVILWFPGLTGREKLQPIGFAQKLAWLRTRFPRIDNNRWLQLLLTLALALALASIWNSSGRDDVRLLQTSPPELMQQEQAVHQALGNASSSQYLLVSAESLERCLQQEESLLPALDALVADGLFEGYRALSGSLPSLQRQAENYALVKQLYLDRLEPFYKTIKLPAKRLDQAREQVERAVSVRLTPDDWKQLATSKTRQGFIIETSAPTAVTVIRFTGLLDDKAKSALHDLANSTPGLYFVDQVQNVSDLLKKYRAQIGQWLIIAYLIVLAVLLLRYRKKLWRVVLPPLLASVFTLAILVQVEQGINLFHLMALILVLGIGLDMGIFLTETNEALHTWLAVSLSTYTSLLAFGLLALSETPVLHHFGITVAIGLSLVWLLAPTVRLAEPGGEV
jgi:predicted exporter